MAAISINAIFLKHFAIAHGNGEFKEDDWSLFSSFLPMEGTHLTKVKFLKERGDFFKQNMFDSAGGCYEMACRLLCLVLESMEDYDAESVLQLAISLNLNLAACANKLHEYEVAINFCSLVLSSFPKNVKALFRRAIACMKTNMLMEAQTDLETALMLEPKNKDILRELNVVKNLRAINHNVRGV
ncbi:70 kDa peptidyl-prolyl isomerase-like [Silene latifolia]|uniref:70 kDa peptidyl-prolyl isomerase-like n=1 Tax=Silene latifolia TaxID=37657 RepID=UPI003D7863AF